ncbi:hypothetical protein [Candidatus Wolbachia massiliensis]|uniref:Uncharacterized protein n=1 Tax=Candidatus Wolbachia massiliensis TaxID=1845000 RepID=A0A7L7YQ15_9RICK|nr:hypothetical protein [Candidatus Wolbachia massiliensis]QOD37836.1 hypothetical protein ID128_03105 [Candidatus Wolbachia massiliensis]
MNTKVEKNNPKIFPKNEGKINSKGIVAPPVHPKSHQTKFAGIKAIFEQNVPHFQANDSNKTMSSNSERTFCPTMQKLMKDNIHSTPNKQRRDSGDSGISSCSDVSSSTLDKKAKAYNPLDWNPIYQGKKRFSLDNMSSNSSSYSEKSNISDISNKSNNSNIVKCNVTRNSSKEDLREPDARHNDKPADKGLSDVNVSELIRKFEQGNDIVKGR